MAITGKKGFSREDELLLQDFSKNVSTKSSALFYGNALIVSAIPVWLFWRIHSMDPVSSGILFAVVTIVSTWLVAFAYRNTKHLLKHKVAVKRESAVTKELSRQLNDDKKISRKEKDERILWKKNEVAEYEATTFAIFYNNALFLSIMVFASFYVLKTLSPSFNYVASMGVASGVIALVSTRSQA
jgi:translocon-associated protein subunit gamma